MFLTAESKSGLCEFVWERRFRPAVPANLVTVHRQPIRTPLLGFRTPEGGILQKILGTSGVKRVAAALVVFGTLWATGGTMAQSASANTSDGGCRDKGYAGETYGISELPCSLGDHGTGVYGQVNYRNPNNVSIFPCAQLLKVNADNVTTTQVADFGCLGTWVRSNQADGSIQFNTKDIGVHNGTYIVQAGYWEYDPNGNLVYILGAQGSRVQVYG